MTTKKLQRFYNFIDALKAMNNFGPYYFNGGSITAKNGRLLGSCLSASVDVGLHLLALQLLKLAHLEPPQVLLSQDLFGQC